MDPQRPKLAAVSAVLVASLACARPRTPAPSAVPASSPPPSTTAAATPLPANFARGVSYAHDWSQRGARGYGTPSDRAELARVRALGATWISVMPFGFMGSASETRVGTAYDRSGGESDLALRATIREAHTRGLRVLLKPHLWVHGTWPGAIDPPREEDACALIESWASLTLHYADLAAQEGAEALTLGVEMDKLARRCPLRWRALIASTRLRFRGTLTYAAGWSDVAEVPFWDGLDVIGADHYAPLAAGAGPVDAALLERAARESLRRYERVSQRFGKPVWLTELGFRRDARALVEPWRWVQEVDAPELDLQSAGYASTLRALREVPCIEGVFAWKWFSSGGQEEEGSRGFAFEHTPAERVIGAAFASP